MFTRVVDDRTFSYSDFAVPVYQKRRWKRVDWKNLGQKMYVPMIANDLMYVDKPSQNALSVLNWYQ